MSIPLFPKAPQKLPFAGIFGKLHIEGRFKIMLVPNVTNICYGRGVGYKIEEIVLPEEIQKISATKIRAKMREEGKLK